MFGTLKPHSCGLGCSQRHEYATFYCGLCKSLGDSFGTITRALLSYDAVFLALVADGLMEAPAAPDRCRCPVMPVAFRPTVRPDSPAMRYAAAMQMLLSDQWLADRAMDGKRVARAARPLISGKVDAARAILGDLGVSLADLDGFEHRQARCEIAFETGPRAAAEPTASALELVFDRMALLPGVVAEARSAEGRAALGAFGRHLGSAIYLIDALDDLEKDHAGGAFNPCLEKGPRGDTIRVAWDRIEAAWDLLHDDLRELLDLCDALPFQRHRELVKSVVCVELHRLAEAAARRAHAYARSELERVRAARRAETWSRRVVAAAAAVFVLLWVWLSSLPALAQGKKRAPVGGARDAGAADAGKRGVAPPDWNPTLPRPPAPSATASPKSTAPTPRNTGGSVSPTEPNDPKGGPAGGTGSPGSGGGGGSCNPCESCCKSLFDSCGNKCCDSCGRCFDGCNICKGCGDSCKGCDSCCKGCNGCNNCGNCCR